MFIRDTVFLLTTNKILFEVIVIILSGLNSDIYWVQYGS
jgi:hypothetical protein